MNHHVHADALHSTLREIAENFGTPTYAYDLDCIRRQMSQLRTQLPPAVEVLYSLKANASLGLCSFIAAHGFGADVASAGELATARAAGFPPARIFLTGPDKSPPVLAQLRELPDVVVSLDSVSELELCARQGLPNRSILRLRPDFCSFATCSAGPDSRFGLRFEDLPRCRALVHRQSPRVIGFHVFSGSQVLDTQALLHHLQNGFELCIRAGDALGVKPLIIDLGGGFGVPYGPEDKDFDLAVIADAVAALADRAPAKIVIELGRYFVAAAGWYLTSVIATQSHGGRPAAVVDGGTHQRGDMCGLGLRRRAFPPLVLGETTAETSMPTDVLGCLSLPSDVLIESALLPPLHAGDVLAFPNAGAYGLAASPHAFHAHNPPAEVAFDGGRLHVLRERAPLSAVLDGQLGGLRK